MKTLYIVIISILVSTYPKIQEQTTANAVFDGFFGGIYSFTLETDDEDEFGKTIEFTEISPEILKKYDLKSDAFEGETFTITYSIDFEVIESDDEDELEEEVYKLISIVKNNRY